MVLWKYDFYVYDYMTIDAYYEAQLLGEFFSLAMHMRAKV